MEEIISSNFIHDFITEDLKEGKVEMKLRRTGEKKEVALDALAEMMGSSSGLGYFIRNFADYANYTNVIAGIFLVALVVTALNGAVSLIEKKAVRWK